MDGKDSWGLTSTCAARLALYSHLHAILQFFKPFDGDGLPRLESLHCRRVAIGGANGNVGDRSGLVRFDQVDKLSLRVALYRRGGDENGVMRRIDQQPRIDELIGKQ